MSKTLGNVIDLEILKRHFANDAVRYYCLREMAFGQDSDFTYGSLIDRTNADLADGLGNLFSRVLSMIRKYCNGVIPAAEQPPADEAARSLLLSIERRAREVVAEFDQFHLNRGLEAAWGLIAETDKLISDARPWDLARQPDDRPRLESLLNIVTRSLHALAISLYPVIPDAAREMGRVLSLPQPIETYDPARISAQDDLAGQVVGSFSALFPKIEKESVMSEINSPGNVDAPAKKPESAAAASVPAAPKDDAAAREYISIEEFAKIDLRVGRVLAAEKVEKADRLLRLTIDLGEPEPRQVLAGIAQHYTPEQLIGRKVVVVANLMPRRLRGYESNGMILAASVGEEGKPVLAGFLEDVPDGARLK